MIHAKHVTPPADVISAGYPAGAARQMNRFAFLDAVRVRRRRSSRIGPPRTVVCVCVCVEGTMWANIK